MSVDNLNVALNLDAEEFADGMRDAISLVRKLNAAIEVTDDGIRKNKNIIKAWAKSVRGSVTEFYSLTQLVAPIGRMVGSITTSFIRANAEFEKTTAVLTGLTRNASSLDEATANLNAQLENLEMLARSTPFNMEALQSSMVKLKAGGVEDLDFAMDALINSVASFGGSSQELSRASIAIQQMAGKGVVSMEELRQQLGEAVPNAMQLMARGLNVSMGELAALVQTGTLEATSALNAMFMQMSLENEGASERMMGTWDGLMAQISARLNKIMREMGGSGLFDELKAQLQTFLDFLNRPETLEFFVDLAKDITVLIQETIKFIQYVDDLNVVMETLRDIVIVIGVTKFAKSVGAAGLAVSKLVNGLDDTIKAAKGVARPLSTMRAELEKQNRLTKASIELWGFNNAAMIKSNATLQRKKIVMAGLTGTMKNVGKAVGVFGRRVLALAGPVGIAVSIVLELADAFNVFGNEVDNVREKALDAASALSPDEYNVLAHSVEDARQKVSKLTKEFEQQEKIFKENGKGTREGNTALSKMSKIKVRIADINKETEESVKALEKQNKLLARAAGRSFADDFSLEMSQASKEISLKYQQDMNKLEKLRANPDELPADELKAKLAGMKKVADQAYLDRYSSAARAAAKEVYQAKKTEIEKSGIEEDARKAQLQSLKSSYDTQLAEITSRETELINRIGEVRQKGAVTLNKGGDFWDKAYDKSFIELAGWTAKVTGENVNYAKSLAKMSLEKEGDVTHTRAQTEALAAQIQRIRDVISANKELDNIDKQIVKEQAKVAASQKVVEESNPWLQISDDQRNYIKLITQSKDRTAEMTATFGAASDQAQRAAAQTLQFQQLLADQEGADLVAMTRSMQEQTKNLEKQSMTEAQLRESRRMDYQEQRGYINALINDVDNISAKTGIAKDELVETFSAYGKALDENFNTKNMSAVESLMKSWSDATTAMDQMWADTFQNLSSTLTDFVMTGKLDFKSLTNSIIRNMIQISIQSAMSNIFGAAGGGAMFGFADGGVMSSQGAIPLRKYAEGGIAKANHPQLAMYGEGSMNEAYVPLPDGRSIPVSMNGQQAPNVSVNVINQTGTQADAQEQGMKFDGEKWVLDVVMTAMNRPGQFRSAMKGGTRQ